MPNTVIKTGNIADNAVTLAKVQTIATDTFLGRDSSGTGNVEVLAVETVKTMLGVGDTSQSEVNSLMYSIAMG